MSEQKTNEPWTFRLVWGMITHIGFFLVGLAVMPANSIMTDWLNQPNPKIEDIITTAEETPIKIESTELISAFRGVFESGAGSVFRYGGVIDAYWFQERMCGTQIIDKQLISTECREYTSQLSDSLKNDKDKLIDLISLLRKTVSTDSGTKVNESTDFGTEERQRITQKMSELHPLTRRAIDQAINSIRYQEALFQLETIVLPGTELGGLMSSSSGMPLRLDRRTLIASLEGVERLRAALPSAVEEWMSLPDISPNIDSLRFTTVVSNFGKGDLIVYPEAVLRIGGQTVPLILLGRADREEDSMSTISDFPAAEFGDSFRSPVVVKKGEADFLSFRIDLNNVTLSAKNQLQGLFKKEPVDATIEVQTQKDVAVGKIEKEAGVRPLDSWLH